MYLIALEIKNFRGIKELNLNFSSGLNILIGENNSGDALVVSDFAEGKYRYDNSKFKDGFKKIESALLKYIFNKEFYSSRELRNLTERIEFAN